MMLALNKRLSFTSGKLVAGHRNNTPQSGYRNQSGSNSEQRAKEVASIFGGYGADFFGSSNTSMQVGISGPMANQYMLTGLVPEQEDLLRRYYRDIYWYDSVSGSACDLISMFPFSDWTLSGAPQEKLLKYEESLSRLNIRALMPEISLAYLVDAEFIGTLIFNQQEKVFVDLLVHAADDCNIKPLPFYSSDPIIHVRNSKTLTEFMSSNDRESRATRALLPAKLIQALRASAMKLDPLLTLYIARRTLPNTLPTSFLKRVLMPYLIEKTLFRGTLVEATKRQRAMLHITMGDGDWEPTPQEMQETVNQFQLADFDPLGAVLATRSGVSATEVRAGGDFWKWTDVVDNLTPIKLRALGISEAFLSGDACLTGDTLITTDMGLVRLDSLGEGKEFNKVKELDLDVMSRYGWGKAVGWIYNGFREVFGIVTAAGNKIRATDNHQFLVLAKGVQDWKRVDELSTGDVLCILTDEFEYKFSQIVDIIPGVKEHVYDLCMKEGTEPAFVANGLVVHNSYSNVETAMSVFMENLDAYRSLMTYKTFTNKLFPIVAISNDYFKSGKEVDTDTRTKMKYQVNNYKDLIIPSVRWHKNLAARNEDNTMDLLGSLSEKGVPVPLRMWAAAAKVDLNALLQDLEQDEAIKKRIADITKVNPDEIGKSDEDIGGMEEASVMNRLGSILPLRRGLKHRPLLARKFDDEADVMGVSKTGKRKWVYRQKDAIAAVNSTIAKAVSALNDPHIKQQALKRIAGALGRVPAMVEEIQPILDNKAAKR
jgi:hypothetical protein